MKKGMNEKLHKILYIALSLLLAVAFWLFVDNEQENTIERPFNGIPVEFIGWRIPRSRLRLTFRLRGSIQPAPRMRPSRTRTAPSCMGALTKGC